jgi:hypothetical protein
MDVRAKQRLSYHVVLFPLICVLAVSPHVNSTVRCFSVSLNGAKMLFDKIGLA